MELPCDGGKGNIDRVDVQPRHEDGNGYADDESSLGVPVSERFAVHLASITKVGTMLPPCATLVISAELIRLTTAEYPPGKQKGSVSSKNSRRAKPFSRRGYSSRVTSTFS